MSTLGAGTLGGGTLGRLRVNEDDLDNLFGGLAGALVRALATPLLRIMEGAGGSDSQDGHANDA